jgi:hypothetical protein
MKRSLMLIVALLLSTLLFAQTPEKISYQAVIRNNNNGLVTNQSIGMRISILQGSVDGTEVYVETQTPSTNANGLVSIEFGGEAGFSSINWTSGPFFIKTETDPSGGTNYTITGTSQILSVPFALHAKTADNILGGVVETDPVFASWDKSTGITISESQISNLGNYIETETDPAVAANFDFTEASTGDLLQFNGTRWVKFTPNYLTSFTETDPEFAASPSSGITNSQITNWNSAYSWGNHSTKGYLGNGGEYFGSDRTVGNRTEYSLGFKTNDLVRLHISSDGKLGVNTSNPMHLLHIKDNEIPENFVDDDMDGWVDETDIGHEFVFTSGGRLGIGTTTPLASLHIEGNILIADGTQGAGKVLTSDENGVASWQTAGGGGGGSGWSLTGNSGIDDETNFIGTTEDIALVFKVNNIHAGRIEGEAYANGSYENTFLGYKSGLNTIGRLSGTLFGFYNTAVGSNSFVQNTNGNGNTAMGTWTLEANTTGDFNSAFGSEALGLNTGGSYNSTVGYASMVYNTTGNYNSAVGTGASLWNSTGNKNAALGAYALYYNNDGSYNTAVGSEALHYTLGSYNTALGYQAGSPFGSSLTNATAIGAGAVVISSNTVQIGNNAVTEVRMGDGSTATVVTGGLITVGLKVAGGSPAAGKVLTSDSQGNATWQTPSGSEPITYSVGDFAHGGIVFWVDEAGQHGLVCAKTDQSSGVRWYAGSDTYTMALGDGPMSGKMNTLLIIASQSYGDGSTYAARICNELQITVGGKTYGDWYLPSKEELNLMYLNKDIINTTALANGGNSFGIGYWTSTEESLWNVWSQVFNLGIQGTSSKDTSRAVRAIRAF